uniref:Decoralin n=1 Tax=Oreumenes decoratus TaxID=531920 RepID=DCRLN_OREDC|nr:RecName: Full=Decoralin; Short=DEC [Oreumenes decoratus]
SLLSLIRKLIT